MEFNLNKYNYDYFFNEIMKLYDVATNEEKIKLLNLLWLIRTDKSNIEHSRELTKNFNEKLSTLLVSMGG